MVTYRRRHVTLKGQTRDPNTLRAQYLENSWICYLATIANYQIVWCEAELSAVLATAWLLVVLLACYDPSAAKRSLWHQC